MSHDSNRGYQVYHSLLGMVLSLALIVFVNEYYILKVHAVICLLYSLIPALLIYLFERNKKNSFSYIVLLGFIPLAGILFLATRTNPITWVMNIARWVKRYDQSEKLYELVPAYIILAVVSVISSILLYIIIKKILTRLILGVVVFCLIVVFAVLNIHMGKLVVGIAIFYISNILIELSGIIYSKKYGKEDKKEGILYLLPICVLLAVIAAGMPSKQEPIQWSGVKSLYNTMKNQIDNLITKWEFFVSEGGGVFSISLTGYSDDGSLDNNDLHSSPRVALIVAGRKGLSPVYLTGSVSDTYTGYSWEKSGEDFLENEQEYQMDYGELIYGLSRLEPGILDDNRLIESKTMKIIYNNIKTKTFFYPLKSKWYNFDNTVNGINIDSASITFPKVAGNKMAYNISYYEMNLQSEVYKKILRNADEFSYTENRNIDLERIGQLEKEFFVRDRDSFILSRQDFYEVFRERAAIINNKYTQLPQDIPTRVKDLAYDLTKDKDNKYDKLKALEAYLLELEYSYTPGKVPKGEDFTDYFIFENKQGYCTSFATAMAVLGRSIGIPTRYVEGYVVDYGDKDDTGYLVRNSSAHAWMEAYFEGMGWIPFEATPSYYEQRYTTWAPVIKREKTDYSQYYNMMNENTYMEEATEIPGFYKKKEDSNIFIWVLVILAITAIILLIVVLYYLILQHRYKKEYDRSDYNGQMYLTFLRILNLLRKEGFTLELQDTLLMLSERINNRYEYKDIMFRDVVNIYMGYRYGEMKINDKELEKVKTFYDGMLELRKQDSKPLKLHVEEFVFLLRRKSYSTTYQDK